VVISSEQMEQQQRDSLSRLLTVLYPDAAQRALVFTDDVQAAMLRLGLFTCSAIKFLTVEQLTNNGLSLGVAAELKRVLPCEQRQATAGVVLEPFAGSPLEGIHGRPITISREAMCERLWAQTNKVGFVIIKAPPQSGKTSLLQLFKQYVENLPQDIKVYFFNPARASRPFEFDIEFDKQCGIHLSEVLQSGNNAVVLIDEGQLLYNQNKTGSGNFWGQMKALHQGVIVCA
jgi:hypothetical protein